MTAATVSVSASDLVIPAAALERTALVGELCLNGVIRAVPGVLLPPPLQGSARS